MEIGTILVITGCALYIALLVWLDIPEDTSSDYLRRQEMRDLFNKKD